MNRLTKPPTPLPAQIKAARVAAGLTQTQAAQVIHSTMRTWQDWEAGKRKMHPAMLELFLIKIVVDTEDN